MSLLNIVSLSYNINVITVKVILLIVNFSLHMVIDINIIKLKLLILDKINIIKQASVGNA